ncbi:MAG TPA: DUF177 domain-containing protein [Desulfobacteraceae bacterium]|nr:DUF177 domain-containing protein [Desulfobacteraceae bacterium]
MLVDLTSIDERGKDFSFFLDSSWWHKVAPEEPFIDIESEIEVSVSIYKAGSHFVVDGKMEGVLLLSCDRCLERFSHPISSPFKLYLEEITDIKDIEEAELSEGDLDIHYIQGKELELNNLLREQIFLSIPFKNLCTEQCKGLCPVCGENLNIRDCGCTRPTGHPAFQKLAALKGKLRSL